MHLYVDLHKLTRHRIRHARTVFGTVTTTNRVSILWVREKNGWSYIAAHHDAGWIVIGRKEHIRRRKRTKCQMDESSLLPSFRCYA